MQDAIEILESKGVKATANRLLVLKELMSASRPVNLADLEESLPTMDKTSIFRVLELFASRDVVHVLEDGSRSLKYELCHGGAHHSPADQHVHFYCESCGKTYCLSSIAVPEIAVPAGFLTHSINYMIKGLCPSCSERPDR